MIESRLRSYYRAVKPGIVYGNMLHVLIGVLLALRYQHEWSAALGVVVGTAFVIASACVINNIIDREYDAKMQRTKSRPLAAATLSVTQAAIFAGILAIIGFTILATTTNMLTTWLGVIAYVSYAFIYTYSKRATVHSTLIGTIPGALPAMAGYTAVSGTMDVTAWLIFLVIVTWQLPHFYAIAVFRRQDYLAAGLPILSTMVPVSRMRQVIMVSVAAFWLSALCFSLIALSLPSAIVFMIMATYWLFVVVRSKPNEERWARRIFGVSMQVSLALCLVALVDFALSYGMK